MRLMGGGGGGGGGGDWGGSREIKETEGCD